MRYVVVYVQHNVDRATEWPRGPHPCAGPATRLRSPPQLCAPATLGTAPNPRPQAAESDYLSLIADRTGVPLWRLLLDNTAVVADPQAPVAGKALTICGARDGAMGAFGVTTQVRSATTHS